MTDLKNIVCQNFDMLSSWVLYKILSFPILEGDWKYDAWSETCMGVLPLKPALFEFSLFLFIYFSFQTAWNKNMRIAILHIILYMLMFMQCNNKIKSEVIFWINAYRNILQEGGTYDDAKSILMQDAKENTIYYPLYRHK